MEPSNFRYNPYDDIPTGVEITERHIIPANSPYYIRLNEVPQKNSPSTMAVKEITDISTTVTYGQTFNEVAANPASGEFWPDCNTGANGDDNWNTGLIAFNAADAGKLIEVTYTGTGTLAGVNSNHWPSWYTDRGDGSDGDFAPTENTTISGIKNYTSVNIPSGVTVTVTKYAIIKTLGGFNNFGTLTADGQGGAGGAAGYGSKGSQGGGGHIARGGAGGKGNDYAGGYGTGNGYIDHITIDESNREYFFEIFGLIGYGGGGGGGGSFESTSPKSGGAGGAGGGSICIVCKELNNQGTISSKGIDGGNGVGGVNYNSLGGGGGGGGGSIVICAETVVSEGILSVDGGTGGSYSGNGATAGAAGEDGILKIIELGVL